MSEFSAFSRGLMAGYSVVNNALNQRRERELQEREYRDRQAEHQRVLGEQAKDRAAHMAFSMFGERDYDPAAFNDEEISGLYSRIRETDPDLPEAKDRAAQEGAIRGFLYSRLEGSGKVMGEASRQRQLRGALTDVMNMDPETGATPAQPIQIGSGGSGSSAGGRNNNPGNLRPSADNWQGKTGVVDTESGQFVTFDTPENGFRAMAKNLRTYGSRGDNTVAKIINKWAPPSDNNDTEAYVETVANALGIDPNAELNLNDPGVVTALTAAMTQVETGGKHNFTNEQLVAGVNAAFEGPKYSKPLRHGGGSVATLRSDTPAPKVGAKPAEQAPAAAPASAQYKLTPDEEAELNSLRTVHASKYGGPLMGDRTGAALAGRTQKRFEELQAKQKNYELAVRQETDAEKVQQLAKARGVRLDKEQVAGDGLAEVGLAEAETKQQQYAYGAEPPNAAQLQLAGTVTTRMSAGNAGRRKVKVSPKQRESVSLLVSNGVLTPEQGYDLLKYGTLKGSPFELKESGGNFFVYNKETGELNVAYNSFEEKVRLETAIAEGREAAKYKFRDPKSEGSMQQRNQNMQLVDYYAKFLAPDKDDAEGMLEARNKLMKTLNDPRLITYFPPEAITLQTVRDQNGNETERMTLNFGEVTAEQLDIVLNAAARADKSGGWFRRGDDPVELIKRDLPMGPYDVPGGKEQLDHWRDMLKNNSQVRQKFIDMRYNPDVLASYSDAKLLLAIRTLDKDVKR